MLQVVRAQNYYALLCDCGEKLDRYMLCGVYASREEAKEANKGIAGCLAGHIIKKCGVEVVYKKGSRNSATIRAQWDKEIAMAKKNSRRYKTAKEALTNL